MSHSHALDALIAHMAEVMRLGQIQGLLSWDQQVNLPPEGHADRAEHAALISGLIQRRCADPRVGAWLDALEGADLDERQAAGVRNLRRTHERAVKVPAELAARKARAGMEGYAAWQAAREEGDFGVFAPALQLNLDLALEEAAAVDPDRHPYDVLLEDYDPGTTVADLRDTFGRLREGLVVLIGAVRAREPTPAVERRVDLQAQWELNRMVTEAMGYHRRCGRIDEAIHPFTVAVGRRDVRITTRLDENDLLAGLGGTMHEAGHALYELGLPREPLGSGIDSAASLGVHESQSRFWENFIGHSRPFLEWVSERLEQVAPGGGIAAEDLYRAANRIEPTMIRVYADEVTYNLHIIARFELELALVEGRLAVRDLPEAWNEKYRELLGLEPADDVEGVLQDVHWSGGTFGYFPSYTLGNLYAAALGRAMQADLPDLWEGVRRGELAPVLGWLRDRIHRHGHTWDGAELIRRAAGEVDLVETLLDALWGRHGALYGVSRPR